MKETATYSAILQVFTGPLLDAKDTDKMISAKFKVAEIIWNYCIAKDFHLPVFADLYRTITEQNEKDPQMKFVFDVLAENKRIHFKQYNNFIVKSEFKMKADGSKSLYVESIDPEIIKKLYYEQMSNK